MFEAVKDQLVAMKKALRSISSHRWIETLQGKIALWNTNPTEKSDELTVLFIHGLYS